MDLFFPFITSQNELMNVLILLYHKRLNEQLCWDITVFDDAAFESAV